MKNINAGILDVCLGSDGRHHLVLFTEDQKTVFVICPPEYVEAWRLIVEGAPADRTPRLHITITDSIPFPEALAPETLNPGHWLAKAWPAEIDALADSFVQAHLQRWDAVHDLTDRAAELRRGAEAAFIASNVLLSAREGHHHRFRADKATLRAVLTELAPLAPVAVQASTPRGTVWEIHLNVPLPPR